MFVIGKEDQCSPPELLAFGDVIDPPSSGFSIGVVVQVSASCGPGQQGYMRCQNNKTWSSVFECSGKN